MSNTETSWHTKTIKEAFALLRSSDKGLVTRQAEKHLEEDGLNNLVEGKKRAIWQLYLDQFKDFMILVLLAAAIISGILGDIKGCIAIIVIVVLNAVIGFVQEYRAERAMEALKGMAAPMASLIRDGSATAIPASLVVPGDIVLLEAGNVVPADLRLIETHRLQIEEAALTGESNPVEKIVEPLPYEDVPLGDRLNLAYKGTIVTYGRGSGLAVHTGMRTEIGKIASMIQEEQEVKTPLQKRLAAFGKRLAIAALAICAIVFLAGIMRGEPLTLMFLTAVSLAVAAIPEALPAVITISLALGASKMAKRRALIRKLPAVETLGSVTYICSDKTGTLTMNRMAVQKVYCNGKLEIFSEAKENSNEEMDSFFRTMGLNNDAMINSEGLNAGDPTDNA